MSSLHGMPLRAGFGAVAPITFALAGHATEVSARTCTEVIRSQHMPLATGSRRGRLGEASFTQPVALPLTGTTGAAPAAKCGVLFGELVSALAVALLAVPGGLDVVGPPGFGQLTSLPQLGAGEALSLAAMDIEVASRQRVPTDAVSLRAVHARYRAAGSPAIGVGSFSCQMVWVDAAAMQTARAARAVLIAVVAFMVYLQVTRLSRPRQSSVEVHVDPAMGGLGGQPPSGALPVAGRGDVPRPVPAAVGVLDDPRHDLRWQAHPGIIAGQAAGAQEQWGASWR
jgi:hypothetical protein